jgi:hypothetical protein
MTTPSTQSRSDAWATGLSAFGGVWLLIVGLMGFFQGLSAVLNDEFFVVGIEYVYKFDLTTWGWIHLILGVALFVVGLFVLQGATWARYAGVGLAGLSIIANFLWLPYYPLWSIVMMAAAGFVIWGLLSAPPDYADDWSQSA